MVVGKNLKNVPRLLEERFPSSLFMFYGESEVALMAKLTDKQRAFVDEYLIDLNATRAYKTVYKSCKKDETARVNASKLLTNANIKEKIEERMADRAKRTEITQDKVLTELAKIAFANGADFAKVVQKTRVVPTFTQDGVQDGEKEITYEDVQVLATDQLPKDKLAAISGIKATKEGIEVKMNDKVKALELIGRHLGMFNDKLEVKGSMNVNNPYENLTEEQLLKLMQSQ